MKHFILKQIFHIGCWCRDKKEKHIKKRRGEEVLFGKSILQSGCCGPLTCFIICYLELSNVKKVFVRRIRTILYMMVFFSIMDACNHPKSRYLIASHSFMISYCYYVSKISNITVFEKSILHSIFLSNGANNVMHT